MTTGTENWIGDSSFLGMTRGTENWDRDSSFLGMTRMREWQECGNDKNAGMTRMRKDEVLIVMTKGFPVLFVISTKEKSPQTEA